MAKLKDLTDMRFGLLTAIVRQGTYKSGGAMWLCQCDCGNMVVVRAHDLIQGCTWSCGCEKKKTGYKPTPLIERFWNHTKKEKGCWEFDSCDVHGYGQLSTKCGSSPIKAHRLSWEMHNGAIPNGLDVLHHCDNPPCVNPDHLFLGTQADNVQDAMNKDRLSHGEKHYGAKLTDIQVEAIRQRYASENVSQQTLAQDFGVSRGHIGQLVRGNCR